MTTTIDYLNFFGYIFNLHNNPFEQFSVGELWTKANKNPIEVFKVLSLERAIQITEQFFHKDVLEEIQTDVRKGMCIMDRISLNFSSGACTSIFGGQGNHMWNIWKKVQGHAGQFLSMIGKEHKESLIGWLSPFLTDDIYTTENPTLSRPIIITPVLPLMTGNRRGIRGIGRLSSLGAGGAIAPVTRNQPQQKGARGIGRLSSLGAN